jgi:hypothetical protein
MARVYGGVNPEWAFWNTVRTVVSLRNVVASPCCDTPLKHLWVGVASKHSLFAFSSLRRGGVDKRSIGG